VSIPDHGEDRINVIPTVAKRLKKDPLELFGRVIDDTLGLPTGHAVVVDLGVFERTVDVVGGVQIDVPCPIVDSFLDDRVPGGRRKLELVAGEATLDGPTAAMYVRSRHGRSDFGRSRRQQAVLLGLRERVLESDGWMLLPALFDEVEKSLVTNMKRYELLDLARRALELDRSRLHGLVLSPPLTTAHKTEDGKSVLLPEREAIDRAIASLFTAPPPGDHPSLVGAGAPTNNKAAAGAPNANETAARTNNKAAAGAPNANETAAPTNNKAAAANANKTTCPPADAALRGR
jgi:LCP family protein required for cell wall assembly